MLLCHRCDIMTRLAHYSTHFSNGLTLIEMQIYYSSFLLFTDFHIVSYSSTDSFLKCENVPLLSDFGCFLVSYVSLLVCLRCSFLIPHKAYSFLTLFWENPREGKICTSCAFN